MKSLPGCSDYVEDFQLQEIDGQALMLLKADHLMSAMAIKLGPALKICSAIDAMREELKQVTRMAGSISLMLLAQCKTICAQQCTFTPQENVQKYGVECKKGVAPSFKPV